MDRVEDWGQSCTIKYIIREGEKEKNAQNKILSLTHLFQIATKQFALKLFVTKVLQIIVPFTMPEKITILTRSKIFKENLV